MLYILPPPRAPPPPSPWLNIPKRSRQIHRSMSHPDGNHEGTTEDSANCTRNAKSLSECYFAGKGAALVLPAAEAQKSNRRSDTQGSNIQKHLQCMFYLLRPEETLKMAVKLESVHPHRTRFLVVVSRLSHRRECGEESCLLGIDCNEKTTVGLVLKVMADTAIRLDGDGGFSVSVCGRHHIFKPVSVQAMWSALQTLHKVSSKAREQNYFPGGGTHQWVHYYEDRIESDRSCLNEWHAMDSLESRRPPSPDSVRLKPVQRDETEYVIKSTLKEIMMTVDLDEVTSKFIRSRLEEDLNMDLGEYKSFIDQEMITILGQMDAPTEIFDHVYLGSEWNASNYEELQKNGVGHILNVTREIDNFFPGTFDYLNVRVYDDEKTDLLKHWDDTFKYISKAKKSGSKVLVHCKMGISRSASVVIAYAMKAYNWDFNRALEHVKEKRNCIKPNTNFISQLETYQGILDAMKNKEKLQRSKSETNLGKGSGGGGMEEQKSMGESMDHQQMMDDNDELAELGVAEDNGNGDGDCNDLDLARERHTGATLHDKPEFRSKKNANDCPANRPKSWSPDNNGADEQIVANVDGFPLCSHSINKSTSVSLEDLSSQQQHHVLLPCENGESYSVSPNQIVHLSPGDAFSKRSKQWDAGSPKVSPEMADVYSKQLDCMLERDMGDSDRVPMSRQSSWSSYDSAISRHSSWGSGDNHHNHIGTVTNSLSSSVPGRDGGSNSNLANASRNSLSTRPVPSRNSSWGSYDLKPKVGYCRNERGEKVAHHDVHAMFEDHADKEAGVALPWCAQMGAGGGGTVVGRTRQQIEDRSAIDIITSPRVTADGNAEIRLSVSAPEADTGGLILLRKRNSNDTEDDSSGGLSKSASHIDDSRLQRESSPSGKRLKDTGEGLVKSLKKEYEAKAQMKVGSSSSLPSSPIQITVHRDLHQPPSQPQSSPEQSKAQLRPRKTKSSSSDELTFKSLLGLFETKSTQLGCGQNIKRNNHANRSNSMGTNRYSCIEVSVEKSPVRITQTAPTLNHKDADSSGGAGGAVPHKRPPLSPVVRNCVATVSAGGGNNSSAATGFMVAATVIAKAAKKQQEQQQYGKSHPLARLSLKPRHNPVYNTM